jgi:hypothetical protein
MKTRECPFCGKKVSAHVAQCSYCRETLLPAPKVSTASIASTGGAHIRRGLLYMLLAGVIAYFAGGYSSWKPPIPVSVLPFVSNYLCLLLFLSGLALAVYGFYLQHRTA